LVRLSKVTSAESLFTVGLPQRCEPVARDRPTSLVGSATSSPAYASGLHDVFG